MNQVLLIRFLMVLFVACGIADADETEIESPCPELNSTTYLADPRATTEGVSLRCDLVELLKVRGVVLTNSLGDLVFTELSKPYLTVYDVSGELPLPKQVVDDLLEHIPKTAHMVNQYQNTKYQVDFVDPGHGRFFATNQEHLHALFTYIYRDIGASSSDYFFHETGQAKVLFWKMWGNTIIRFEINEMSRDEVRYKATIYAFAQSKFIHLLIGSGPFRYFARVTFERVVRDIVSATQKYKETYLHYPHKSDD